MLIFSPHVLVFAEKSKFSFYFILNAMEMQKAQRNFFLGRFSFDLTFAVCFVGYNIGCKHT